MRKDLSSPWPRGALGQTRKSEVRDQRLHKEELYPEQQMEHTANGSRSTSNLMEFVRLQSITKEKAKIEPNKTTIVSKADLHR